MTRLSHNIDRLHTTFDHDGLVANAGLIVTATLMSRCVASDFVQQISGLFKPHMAGLLVAVKEAATR